MAEFSDGSPLASQWPMAPLTFFDYEIQVPANEAGTYFYHSHIGMQALTVTGALIVEDCGAPPYEYDEDKVLLFHEHYATEDHKFEEGLLAAPLVFGGEVQSLLLNGAGPAVNHTAGELGEDDKSCNLAIIDVEPGKTYRFRFIGATSLAHSSMAFEGHEEMQVIAVDGGQYTQPAPIDRMQIGSGQRFDVLFKAKTAAELAADGRSDYYLQYETRDRPAVFRGYAIVRYKTTGQRDPLPVEAPAEPVLTLPDVTYDWLESVLQPLVPDPTFPTLEEVTRTIILDARQLTLNETGQIVWQFNGLNWNEVIAYQTPLLVDIYQRGEEAIPNYEVALANQGWDPVTKAFPVKKGEVLEIVLQNTGSLVKNGGGVDVHPMHAHGDHYYDLGSGNGTYNATEWEAQRIARGYTPVKRDTTMLYRYTNVTAPGVDAGWRAWRLRADGAGVWMIHCHTLQHMVMGELSSCLSVTLFLPLLLPPRTGCVANLRLARHANRVGRRKRQRHHDNPHRPQRRVPHLRRQRLRRRSQPAQGVRAVQPQHQHLPGHSLR